MTEQGLAVLFPIVKRRSLITRLYTSLHQFDDDGPFPIRQFNRVMSSEWSRVILALLACVELPARGRNSEFRVIPKDLIRERIAPALPLGVDW